MDKNAWEWRIVVAGHDVYNYLFIKKKLAIKQKLLFIEYRAESMDSTRTKANLCGILAILLWSTIVGLIRNVSEGVGAVAGAALIYTAGSVFLFLLLGSPKLRAFKPAYLFAGGAYLPAMKYVYHWLLAMPLRVPNLLKFQLLTIYGRVLPYCFLSYAMEES